MLFRFDGGASTFIRRFVGPVSMGATGDLLYFLSAALPTRPVSQQLLQCFIVDFAWRGDDTTRRCSNAAPPTETSLRCFLPVWSATSLAHRHGRRKLPRHRELYLCKQLIIDASSVSAAAARSSI
ncbi:hypothetical protein KCP69_00775 [Salmonella enterica subsp. enterica]|nr:hypothetical protein KCP69_00775 [Salmonella enterica subsp. enterica]